MTSYVQDGPPPGGFPKINYKRNVPAGGPSTLALILGCTSVITYGFYRVIDYNKSRRWASREEADIRLSIAPFLMAEADVQAMYYKGKAAEKEAELMKGVPGWKMGGSAFKTGADGGELAQVGPAYSPFKLPHGFM